MNHGTSLMLGSMLLALLATAGCGSSDDTATPPDKSDASVFDTIAPDDAGSEGILTIPEGGQQEAATCDGGSCQEAAAEPACGDGKIDPGETCDDTNTASMDGCTGDCKAVEKGFACPTPGQKCVSTVECGDGKVGGNETCDDHNTKPADGCSDKCTAEPGWTCPVIGAACEAAACGDGIIAGNEQCEDGDNPPADGDGCDQTCLLQPGWKCETAGQPCVPTQCGDGKVEGSEPCDDGNHDMGDGCTPFCVMEPDCSKGACSSRCGDGLRLPGDTAEQCDDGNKVSGDGCSDTCQEEAGFICTDKSSGVTNALVLPIVIRDFSAAHPDFEKFSGAEAGIVQSQLGAGRKPAYAHPGGTSATTSGQASFDQWYRDVPGVNVTILQKLTFNPLSGGVYQYNNSEFFPIDGQGFGNEGNGHNFHFTSEVRYWFEYKGGEQLDFTGDDDVFVFVNARLAVDLGGVHGAMSGSVILDVNAAAQFGLEVGKVYEIAVFQAERHTVQSNYRLTLSNFASLKSECHFDCGDGIVTKYEVCDDGVNNGAYGSCTSDCKARGPYCGDNEIQSSNGEECDDGVNLSTYGGCAPGCKKGSYCGDGAVDSLFGEQCDDGVNDGGYGQCAAGCVFGPRCGDGQLQSSEGEQCDDGNHQNGDGCNTNCRSEMPH